MSSSSVQNCALKVSVLVLSFVAFCNSQNEYSTKNTVSQQCQNLNAQCVEIYNCPPIINLLTGRRKVEVELVRKLRQLFCGWNNATPKVCCLNDTVFTHPKSDTHITITKDTGNRLFPSKTNCGTMGSYINRILGGEEAHIDEFPWMALLAVARGETYRFHCGGTLINDRYVITAAHCAYEQNLRNVRLGEWDLSSDKDCIPDTNECNDPPVDVDIARVIIHPNYDPEYHWNDIALLRLAKQIVYTEWISPICMPFSSRFRKNEYRNEKLTISGWGKTETRQKSLRKMKLNMPVYDFEVCTARYKQANIMLTGRQMCVGGEPGKDSCNGDSGGPLMSPVIEEESENWYIVGITSYGPSQCASPGWPGIYTRIDPYIDWILSQVEQ